MKNFLAALFTVAVLSGCAIGWTRPGMTEAEFYADKAHCENQATQIYPVMLAPTGAGYQAPTTTSCSSNGLQTECVSIPGRYTPPAHADINATSRQSATYSCLQSKGYTYSFGNKAPNMPPPRSEAETMIKLHSKKTGEYCREDFHCASGGLCSNGICVAN
jgi:hypothetical protein